MIIKHIAAGTGFKFAPVPIYYTFAKINSSVLTDLKTVRCFVIDDDIPIVIYTTSADETVKTQALLQGANAFISKPTKFNDLVSQLNNFFMAQQPA